MYRMVAVNGILGLDAADVGVLGANAIMRAIWSGDGPYIQGILIVASRGCCESLWSPAVVISGDSASHS
jgi:hypothetical protein